jgi:abortive infection bacteriophage resistance protein
LHFADALERIEIALRVQMTLQLGRYGAKAHRDPAVFEGFFSRRQDPRSFLIPHQEWMSRTDAAFDKSKEEFVKHFKTKYVGEYPPVWIACETWDFGAMSTLFGGMKKTDQTAIAAIYGISKFQTIANWIWAMNVARNACAHHSRVWNRPLAITPIWPTPAENPLLAHLVGNTKAHNRTYGIALIVRFMLRSINPKTSWGTNFKTICGTFPASPHLSLASAGFPNNWDQEAIWN